MAQDPVIEKNFLLFPKLSSDNYGVWSFKMEALLQQKGVFYTIKNEKPTDKEEIKKWNRDNLIAKSQMILYVEDNQIIHIKNAEHAKDIWEILKNEFQSSSVSVKIRLYKKLFKSQLAFGGSMRQHLNEILNIIDQLAVLGSKMDEDMQVSCILASLNSDYASVVTGIEAWDEARLKLINVKSLLVQEYEKMTTAIGASKTFNSTVITDNRLVKTNPHANLICNYCKRPGHIEKNCYKRCYAMDRARYQEEIKAKIDKKAKQDALKSIQDFVQSQDDKMVEWYVDSGASKHICNQLSLFYSIQDTNKEVIVANGLKIKADGIGNIYLRAQDQDKNELHIHLKEVLYFKSQKFSNLISVSKLATENLHIRFKKNICLISDANKEITIKTDEIGLYTLRGSRLSISSCLLSSEGESACIHEWHKRLSHRNLEDIKRFQNRGIKFKKCNCNDICESCIKGKLSRKSFPKQASETNQVLDIIVSDVCGPMRVTSMYGYRYILTFTDVSSGFTEVKFLRQKSEVASRTIQFIESLKVKFASKPKVFRSDQGTEYINNHLQDYFQDQGIHIQYTVGYAPEQNGVAERKNRTLIQVARTILFESKLPEFLWPEAVNEACYNLNRVLSKSSKEITPYEKFYNKTQEFNDFHVFGGRIYIKIPDEHRTKFNSKAREAIYVGHDNHAKGYRVYFPESRTVKVSRDIVFLEERISKHKSNKNPLQDFKVVTNQNQETKIDQPVYEEENQNQVPNAYPIVPYIPDQVEQDDDLPEQAIVNPNQEQNNDDEEFHDAEDNPIQDPIQVPQQEALRRSQRNNAGKAPDYLQDFEVYQVSITIPEPSTYREAIQSQESNKWIEAMEQEINSLNQNQAWTLVDLPKSRTPVGSKWVFKRKEDQHGNIVEYKARLVAQGFSQKYGEDYDEVFAPVTKSSTFRLLLSISGSRGYQIKHFDIKTAFLNGELQEEIYLKQPPGFKISDQVYKLKKSLYGLKQAARVWNQMINQVLIQDGFVQGQADMCLYIKHFKGKSCYIIIHVDDMLVAGTDLEIINQVYFNLAKHFQVKDLGSAKFFLGISITQDKDGNFLLDQEHYIKKIATEAGLIDAKPSRYPLDEGYYKIQDENLLQDNKEYRKLIGKLLYISTNSRPDISSSISILSQKVTKPSSTDLNEVKRVIRYLLSTKDFKLKLIHQNQDQNLVFYSDANWAEDRITRKSNSGFIGFVNGGTISWACRKQASVSLSSTEAEYIALTETTQEILWLKVLCQDFNIKLNFPIQIQADNQSAIKLVSNQRISNATKHIETKYHFIKDIKEKGTINIKYCPAENNIADMLTKPLGPLKLKQLRESAGLSTYSNLE